jgi:F-type H+-transporting ATPase subunit delta
MKVSELANRYAKAVFELALENKNTANVLADFRALDEVVSKDHDIHNFFVNPLVSAEDRVTALEKAFAGKGLSKEAHDLLVLLAKKDRFAIFHQIVRAFENQADAVHNIVRGTVRSAIDLDPAARERIEKTVERVLNKKVILTYKIDPSVIGGLIAQVGSYTFDDTIDAHLKRMNEELKKAPITGGDKRRTV